MRPTHSKRRGQRKQRAEAVAVEGSDACVVSRGRFGVLVGAGRGTKDDRVAYSIIKTAAAQQQEEDDEEANEKKEEEAAEEMWKAKCST